MEAKQANSFPLEDVLSSYGRHIIRSYSGYDMYLSPFREETHPSFQVKRDANTWKDFGSGEYGSAIDLVMKMENCSFLEALGKFEQRKFGEQVQGKYPSPAKRKETEVSKVSIQKIAPLQNKALLDYLKEQRGIDQDIATKFCQEAYYKREGTDKNLFAVVFMNDSGGMEYRNGAGYKGCFVNKDITTISNGNSRCAVFEGFIDFLTYQQMMKGKPDKLNIDFVILNSTSMVNRAIPFLSEHTCLNCFLDNDPAGRTAFNRIAELKITTVNEAKYHYPDQKDLNEFWVSSLRHNLQMPPSYTYPTKKETAQTSFFFRGEKPVKKNGIKL